MSGKNWNSKSGTYTDIKSEEILNKSKKAQELQTKGLKVIEIAKELGLSKNRIYEYLRK